MTERKAYIINWYTLPTMPKRWTIEVEEPWFHTVVEKFNFLTEEKMVEKINELKNMYPGAITAEFMY